MNIVFSLDFSGSPDADDVLGARHIVFLENKRRTAQNVQISLANAAAVIENARRALLVPPGTSVPIISLLVLLPAANAAQIKASYLSTFLADITSQHIANIALAKSVTGLAIRLTKAEMEQVFANISTRLNAGESVASILSDTAS